MSSLKSIKKNEPSDLYTQVDPGGDVIVVMKDKEEDTERKFLVCSKMLSVASPVFAKLFESRFREGEELRRSGCVEVPLTQDDPDAMATIFRVLHFQNTLELAHEIQAKELAAVATHSDKYECVKALQFFFAACFDRMLKKMEKAGGSNESTAEYGLILLSTYLARSPYYYSKVYAKCRTDLSLLFLSHWTEKTFVLSFLPDTLIDRLAEMIESLFHSIYREMQVRASSLENPNDCRAYVMEPEAVCKKCARQFPLTQRTCCMERLNNIEPYCTSVLRVGQYWTLLNRFGALPSAITNPERHFSASTMDTGIRLAAHSAPLRHKCALGAACPLRKELLSLSNSIHNMVTDEVKLAEFLSLKEFCFFLNHDIERQIR